MLKIATWNVNSIRQRLPIVTEWLKKTNADIVLFQEIKCEEEAFPKMEIEDLGYNLAISGQKTFNGVAILSKFPIDDVIKKLPGDEADEQARYIEAVISLPKKALRVASVYVPNGQEPGSDKFQYKLKFLERLREHFLEILKYNEVQLIGGDYNVAPEKIDVFDPKSLEGTTCFHKDERKRFNALLGTGFYETFRALNKDKQQFSWWDYRGNSWQYNKGMRIDHILASPEAMDLLTNSYIDDSVRAMEKASDHAPVVVEIEI